ncbi:hypothetical protein D3C87_1912360 [compost metagenome]
MENTGSVSQKRPRSFIRMVEWPRRYRLRSGAACRSAKVMGRTGIVCAGTVPRGLAKKNVHMSFTPCQKPSEGRGSGLRKRPSWCWGDCG